MASKTGIVLCSAAAALLAGCSTPRQESAFVSAAARTKPPAATTATEMVAPRGPSATKPRIPSRAAPRPVTPVPSTPARADLPAMIGGATWAVPGQRLTVSRGGTTSSQPVPLFRQASVLASVRAALKDSPAQPQAGFQRGVLNLTFDRGSNEEIAAAVNKALSVPEARNVQVSLQP